MPPFEPRKDRIRKCEGPCGRMTRPPKTSPGKYPDSVCRYNGTHCSTCWKGVLRERGELVPARKPPVPDAEREAQKEAGYAAAFAAEAKFRADRAARLARTQRKVLV